MLICCTMAKAELMDKFFFKIPTDKADGWTLQDAGRMTLTPSKDYLEVKLTNNGGRMINRFWNEDGTFTYNKVAVTRGDGQWQTKWNLFPFSQTEIMKSGNAIVQNEGWNK